MKMELENMDDTFRIFNAEKNVFRCYDETERPKMKPIPGQYLQESHPEREILLILSGKTDFLLNGGKYPAVPGNIFFIDRWVPHQVNYGTIRTDFRHIWLHFHEQRLFGVLYQNNAREQLHDCRSWEHSPGLLAFLHERWDRARKEKEHSGARQQIYCSMARILSEEIAYQWDHQELESSRKTDRIVSWIKNYISMKYGRDASLPELEKLTGYNRFYLMRQFKAEYGMTIGDYINCVRCGFAAAAEAQGKRQKEIAIQLGFQSAAAYWQWRNRGRRKGRLSY